MTALDIRTAYLIVGILYLAMPVAAFIILYGQRSRAIHLWCGGGFVLGVGVILLGLRGMISDSVSILVSNTMIFAALAMRLQSLRIDLGMPLRPLTLATLVAALTSGLTITYYGFASAYWRAIFIGIFHTGLFFYIAWLVRCLGQRWHSKSANWVTTIYILLGLAIANRSILIVLGTVPADPVLGAGIELQLIPLVGVFSAIIGNVGYVGMVLNHTQHQELEAIAARARAEEQQSLSTQLALLDRQRSLGELSAALGHELNQPLTAMLTNAQVARRALAAGRIDAAQLAELLEKIELNSRRAEDILTKLGGLVQPAEIIRRPIDLARLLAASIDLLRSEIERHGIVVFFQRPPGALWAMGDETQLSQVLVNVLRNAIEAMQDMACRELHVQAGMAASGRVEVSIRDTGHGIDETVRTQVGKAFFTTKPNGLGMGLTISRSIMQQHDGDLTLSPAAGGGACATLSMLALPTLSASSAPSTYNPLATERT